MQTIIINGAEMPSVRGRLCQRWGFSTKVDWVEVSCPFCGCVHFHSPKPIPGIRVSHCGLPRLVQPESYYISETYQGEPQPKHQPPDWKNFYGEVVRKLEY